MTTHGGLGAGARASLAAAQHADARRDWEVQRNRADGRISHVEGAECSGGCNRCGAGRGTHGLAPATLVEVDVYQLPGWRRAQDRGARVCLFCWGTSSTLRRRAGVGRFPLGWSPVRWLAPSRDLPI